MKLPPLKKGKWNYLAIAFALPFVLMCAVMIASSYEPFGKHSMLYSDMYHQYYPFFVAFRDALRSGNGVLYSWSVGMGMDYLGLISYYLASPLNLLSVLVPDVWVLEYFALLMPIKLGLAGLFFAIFLKKIFRKDDLSISLFGAFYGLCAWALGYQWNVMWLDTFALLPLVALGTVSLLRDRKFVLYTVTLFLSNFTNYYIGFFTCIFVLLVFICYQICRCKSIGGFFSDLARIALFSILAIGMTAILELPALAALQTTQSSVNQFPTGFRLNIADENTWMGLLDAMRQVAGNMGGGIAPSFKEGLPNLYCGVGTIMLAFQFLMAKKVKLRDKICAVVLLVFFMLSFIIRQLDYIWHGFHFTNMIPYRFSFLFSFVMLYMAYRAYLLRHTFQPWQIALSATLTIAIFACSNDCSEWAFLAFNLVFLLFYTAVMLYGQLHKKAPKDAPVEERRQHIQARIHRRHTAAMALAVVMVLELAVNMVNFGVNFTGTVISNYPKGTEASASMLRYMHEREDSLFYRAEVTHSQTLNDGALNGYNGISTFTSSANVKITEFMQTLGYGAKNTYNRYCFEESSPVANLFLNLKYMLERDGKVEENNYFDEVHHYQNVYLLENNAYLPLGFLANSQLANVNFTNPGNRFSFQNQLLKAASGISGDVWSAFPVNTLEIHSNDVTINNHTGGGYATYNTTNSGNLYFTYTADREGFMCIDLNLSKKNAYTVSKNGIELYSETYSLPQMISVCQVMPGDVIDIRFTCKKSESGTINVSACLLDEELFRQAYEVLNASTLELTEFSSTFVEGTIDCDRDGLLYTSIPQDGNWHVQVDGKDAEVILVGDAMVAVALTKGQHTVSFTYRNAAFSLGWKVSLGCLLVFLALALICYMPERKKGKYEI